MLAVLRGIRRRPAESAASGVVAIRATTPPHGFASPPVDSRRRTFGTITRALLDPASHDEVFRWSGFCWVAAAWLQGRWRAGIAVEDSAQIDPARLRQVSTEISLPVMVRVHVPGAADATTAGIDVKLASYRAAGIAVWLTAPAPASVQDAEPWRQRLATLLQQHSDGIAIFEVAVDREPAALGVFAMKLAGHGSALARRDSHRARRSTRGDAAALSTVYTSELAPYIDLLVVADPAVAAAREVQARHRCKRDAAVAGTSAR